MGHTGPLGCHIVPAVGPDHSARPPSATTIHPNARPTKSRFVETGALERGVFGRSGDNNAGRIGRQPRVLYAEYLRSRNDDCVALHQSGARRAPKALRLLKTTTGE